jgi:hypothetical protein
MGRETPQSTNIDLELDLKMLNDSQLRKKYPVESSTHYRILKLSRESGFEIDRKWKRFSGYLADMGPRPSPKHVSGFVDSRQRIIGPGNFGWLTMTELAAQRPGARVIEFEGARTTAKAIGDRIGRSQASVLHAWQSNSLAKLVAQATRSVKWKDSSWTYPGPKSEADFLISFNNWRKKTLDEGDKRGFPDVFFYLSGMRALSKLEKKLGQSGFTDFFDESQIEQWRSNALSANLGATFTQYIELRQRLLAALGSIARRDADFACSITPTPGKLEADKIMMLLNQSTAKR